MRTTTIAALAMAAALLAASPLAAQDAATTEPAPSGATPDASAPPETAPPATEQGPETRDAETAHEAEAAREAERAPPPTHPPAASAEPEPAPRLTEGGANPTAPTVVPEPGSETPGTSASAILGIATIVAAVGTAIGIGVAVERDDSVGACERFAMEDPRTRGCLNEGAIRDQRDLGIGLAIGFGAAAIGLGIAWAVVATEHPSGGPVEVQVRCAPGLLSFACAGRF